MGAASTARKDKINMRFEKINKTSENDSSVKLKLAVDMSDLYSTIDRLDDILEKTIRLNKLLKETRCLARSLKKAFRGV